MRVARSRELVAQGRSAAVVARVAGISRQAICRRPKRPPKDRRRPLDDVDRTVLEVARENPTDGSRMVAALASREHGIEINRERVQRLMREHREQLSRVVDEAMKEHQAATFSSVVSLLSSVTLMITAQIGAGHGEVSADRVTH